MHSIGKMHTKFQLENLNGRDHLETGIEGRITQKMISEEEGVHLRTGLISFII
jgi:hypothetical protein